MRYLQIHRLILIIVFLTSMITAQEFLNIKGKVVDEKSSMNLIDVDIFINGTTYHSITDSSGNFNMENVPQGKYSLIAVKEGYLPLEVKFNSYNDKNTNFKILMSKTEISNNDLMNSNEDLMDDFPEILLGDGEFSENCRIINSEVLTYNYNNEIENYVVDTKSPLIIFNDAMGYKLFVSLSNFVMDEKINLSVQRCFYFFEALESDDYIERIKWKKNRILTFDGSRDYFFMNLANADLNTRLFNVRRCRYNNSVTSGRFGLKYEELQIGTNDSIVFYLPVNEKLSVLHSSGSKEQVNFFQSTMRALVFDIKGQLLNSDSVMIEGTWAKLKLADLIPENYILDLGK